jgi:hypothetical protein
MGALAKSRISDNIVQKEQSGGDEKRKIKAGNSDVN